MFDIQKALRVLKLKNLTDARSVKAAFRRAVLEVHPDLNPDDPQAEQRMQEVVEAHRELERSLNDPIERLEAIVRRGGFAEAVERAQVLLKSDDSVQARILYAQALYGLNAHADAARQALQVLERETRLDAYIVLGQSFLALGMRKKAAEALKHARTLAGNDGQAQLDALFEGFEGARKGGTSRGDWLKTALGAGGGMLVAGPLGAAVGLVCGLYMTGRSSPAAAADGVDKPVSGPD